MECSKCRFGEYDTLYGGYYCRNPNRPNYNRLNRMAGFGCSLGEPAITEAEPDYVVCSKCRFGEFESLHGGYYCRNPNAAGYNYLSRSKDIGCNLGKPIIAKADGPCASPTNLFTEPKMELYSVVYKIDTDEGHRTKEYLVNATSQERALELAMNYFKNTAQYDESIVGDPIVHVLRKEGVISSSQVGCY